MKFSNIILGLSFVSCSSMVMANDAMTVNAEKVKATTAAPMVEAVQKKEATILVSPRTGMRYTVNNPNNIPIIFKTELIAPATTTNANRIVATNPALSVASQQKAQAALLEMIGPNTQQPTPPVEDTAVVHNAVSSANNVMAPQDTASAQPGANTAHETEAPAVSVTAKPELNTAPLAATDQPVVSLPETATQATSSDAEAVIEKADTAQ